MRQIPSHLALAVGFVLAVPTFSTALPRAPQVEVKPGRKGAAIIRWHIARKVHTRVNLLEIERADLPQKTFRRITQSAAPARNGSYSDAPAFDGRYRYRMRIRTDEGFSAWSKASAIRLRPSRFTPPATPLADGQQRCERGTVAEVLRLVNEARRANGAAPLELHKQLLWSSQTHVIRMAESGNFSHDGWSDYIRQSGFKGARISENIAWGYFDPSSVMNGWLESPGHRANILNPAFRYIGIGCVVEGYHWWVQNFGG